MTKHKLQFVEYGTACDDCVMYIVNHDVSDLSLEQRDRIYAGVQAAEHYLIVGDEVGFKHSECRICHAPAGNRHIVGWLE